MPGARKPSRAAGETANSCHGSNAWPRSVATAGIASKIRCIVRNLKAPCRPASGAGDEDTRVSHADVTCPRARRAGAAPDADGWRARAELPLVRAVQHQGRSAELRLRHLPAMHGDGQRHWRLLRTELHVPPGRRPAGAAETLPDPRVIGAVRSPPRPFRPGW